MKTIIKLLSTWINEFDETTVLSPGMMSKINKNIIKDKLMSLCLPLSQYKRRNAHALPETTQSDSFLVKFYVYEGIKSAAEIQLQKRNLR